MRIRKLKRILPAAALTSLIGVPLAFTSFTSCSRLHVHTFTSDYEYDETYHWKTCQICHEKFDFGEHTFNDLDDRCMICGYKDPLVHINPQTGEMVALTKHGKNKFTFNCPSNVTCIGHRAFVGSKATLVVINKECLWYWEDSFEGSDVTRISFEEGKAETHIEYDPKEKMNKIRIDHVLENKVAMVGDNYFDTLKAAIESVNLFDETTTITLLQEQINETDPIKVSSPITLVPYYDAASLKCTFHIGGAGIVYIPDSVTYEGKVELLLSTYQEIHSNGDTGEHGNVYQDVYNTGSIVFTNASTAPRNVKVSYVNSFGGAQEYEAVGSKQIVNTLLVLPVENYAWGTFRFSKDFKQIWGLTEYGQTVNHLYMTNVVKNITASVAERSFTIGWVIKVAIPYKGDFVLKLFITKGWFFDLTISEGITSIGKAAFNAHAEGGLSPRAIDFLYPVFSHLFTLDLGPDLQTLGEHAFWGSVGLKTITGGKNLQSLGAGAFDGSYNLVSVDFSKSPNFSKISKNAFKDCNSLLQVSLPDGMWSIGDGTYFPYNTLPERIAYALVKSSSSEYTKKTLGSAKYWYTKSTKVDSETGWFSDVEQASTLADAVSKCADGGEIYLSPSLEKQDPRTIYKSDLTKIKTGVTLTAAPEISDAKYIDSNDGVTIKSDEHLILSNVEPQLGEGKNITILSASSDDEKFTKLGSFAIDGLTPEKLEEIEGKTYLSNGHSNMKAAANSASIRGTGYNTFGLYDFSVAQSSEVNTVTISGLSTFGKMASELTFGSPIKDPKTINVVLDNGGSIPLDNTNLVNVNIDDSVIQIGNIFFTRFKNLQNVTIGSNVKSLGDSVFANLASLKNVNILSSDLVLSQQNFSGCTGLTYINLPANLKKIPTSCFNGCQALTVIDIPATVETIDNSAFNGCSALISVFLPEINNLSAIGSNAFLDCPSLTSFDFGQNINNWYVNDNILVPYDELSDPVLAAKLISENYPSDSWKRRTPN